MRHLLKFLCLVSLVIPLALLVSEYYATPQKKIYKSYQPAWVSDGAAKAALTVEQARVMWEIVDDKLRELDYQGRKKDALGSILDDPSRAQLVIGCIGFAWILQVTVYLVEFRDRKRKNEPNKAVQTTAITPPPSTTTQAPLSDL